MLRARSIVFVSPLVFAAACGQPAARTVPDVSATQQGIVGGVSTQAFPAVGLLFDDEQGLSTGDLCTATLVGPQTVVTAAHCVMALDSRRVMQPAVADLGKLHFYTGAQVTSPIDESQLYDVSQVSLPSGFDITTFLARSNDHDVNDDDIALVTLSSSPGIDPLPLATAPLPPQALQSPVILVGYGSTLYAQGKVTGQRRATRVSLAGASPTLLEAQDPAHGTCSGDSGGPVLANGTIIAVTQAGSVDNQGRCSGTDFFTRTDAWAGFLSGSPQASQ